MKDKWVLLFIVDQMSFLSFWVLVVAQSHFNNFWKRKKWTKYIVHEQEGFRSVRGMTGPHGRPIKMI